MESSAQTSLTTLSGDLEARFAEGLDRPWPEDDFTAYALAAFAHQFGHNPAYRAYCESLGRTPNSVLRWQDVPAVPVTAFKHLELVTGDRRSTEAIFRTSGTVGGDTQRGRHFIPRLSLYRASLLPPFRHHVMAGVPEAVFVSFIPPPTELPDSSLSFMAGTVCEVFSSSTTWVVDGKGEIDGDGLASALERAAQGRTPVVLLGTAFAFVNALDADAPLGPLPPGSRIMETGGLKGRTHDVTRHELYSALARATGVPHESIVSEYGMTELQSQLYGNVSPGGPTDIHYSPAPWLRVRALDPGSLEECHSGTEGILAFFDLANAGSISHVLTEDLGRVSNGRVCLTGRALGAEARGCSHAMDDLMFAAR